MTLEVDIHIDKLSSLCETYGVRRLEVFSSAAREDFDSARSDVDFLVDFVEEHAMGPFDRYFGLKESLEQLCDRSVDLVEEKAIRNPYFQQAIKRDRVLVYGA